MFAFKQFKIYQDKTAMKVGTDGVLLGAWVDAAGVKKVLDVGTGTGLIALMTAQRNKEALIDAIDIDGDACEQAKENVKNSPWPERVKVFHSSLEEFARNKNERYDLIVCNPPYFINSKKSKGKQRRLARHADELTPDDLFRFGFDLLSDKGKLGMIFPFENKEMLISAARNRRLFPVRILNVRHNSEKDFVRVLISFSKIGKGTVTEKDIAVETGRRHEYTKEFSELVREFYLYVD